MSAPAYPAAPAAIDFIARLADAWDGRGNHVLIPPAEHQALLRLARLDMPPNSVYWSTKWAELTDVQRRKLLEACGSAVRLGQACAWVLGRGPGAP